MKAIQGLALTFVASMLLIVLGVLYFGLSLWIIRTSSEVFFGPGLDANWAVLASAILAASAIIASGVGNFENR